MTRRFRIWEASAAVRSQSMLTPIRSMATDGSNSTSFRSTFESSGSQSTRYYDGGGLRKRQLIVAVTANSAECEKVNDGGFDEICPKPLTRADIHKVITRHFQFD